MLFFKLIYSLINYIFKRKILYIKKTHTHTHTIFVLQNRTTKKKKKPYRTHRAHVMRLVTI